MEAVTEQLEVLELGRKIVELCDKHTNSIGISRAAVSIADTVMASRQFDPMPVLSQPVRAESV